jgi:ribosomal-protein-alanine N-acetyltransferase
VLDAPSSMKRPWPVELREGPVLLRPLRVRDAKRWRAVRAANAAWLGPWEATHPDAGEPAPNFGQMVRAFGREARAGRMLPFAIELDGELVGQLTVAGITWGSLRSGHIGYWIDRTVAGRGVTPTAVALAADHCFFVLRLHRVEVNIRPENQASLRVARKLGFRPEGVRKRYLHIDGAWRDHATFALTLEDAPGGLMARWRVLAADLAADGAADIAGDGAFGTASGNGVGVRPGIGSGNAAGMGSGMGSGNGSGIAADVGVGEPAVPVDLSPHLSREFDGRPRW